MPRSLIRSLMILILCSSGCAVLKPGADTVLLEVPFVRQEQWYCGAAAAEEIFGYYDRFITQYAVAGDLFSRKRGGILTIDLNLFMRRQGLWTRTMVRDASYRSPQEKEALTLRQFEQAKEFIRRGHPVIALIGPENRDVLGMHIRLFFGPFFYISDYEELVRLNHYILITGYDDERQLLFCHDGLHPNAVFRYPAFLERWSRVDCWALAAMPPGRITWELTTEENLDAGVVLERSGKLDEALERYTMAFIQAADDAHVRRNARFNMANVHIAARRYDEAEAILRELLEDPGDPGPVWNNLAEISLRRGTDLEQAEECIRQALATGPRNQVYYADTYAMILLRKGDAAKAQIMLETVLGADMPEATRAVVRYHRGLILLALDDCRAAFTEFKAALDYVDEDHDPDRESEYALHYGLCGLKLGELDKARTALHKAVALNQGEFGWLAKEELQKLNRE